MKKDKKTEISSSWKKKPTFFKKIFLYIIFSSVFALCVFILIYRYENKINEQEELVYQSLRSTPSSETAPPLAPTTQPAPAPKPKRTPTPKPAPAPALAPASQLAPVSSPESVLLQTKITNQNNRLVHLEATLKQWQSILQLSHQLLALEMLQEVLEGRFPLSTFILYLKKTPEPWVQPVLNNISNITESKTYAQLQASLVLPSQSLSLWEQIKNILISFFRIRKLDAGGHYYESHLDDIHGALKEHNIQQALEVFDKLPPEEQAQLALWKQDAQYRLTLETIKQKMLLDLAGR